MNTGMKQKINLRVLETHFTRAVTMLRNYLKPSDAGRYIYRILLLKRLSDIFEESREKIIKNYIAEGKLPDDARQLASDESKYIDTFFIPEKALWSEIQNIQEDIGKQLNEVSTLIEAHNSSLKDVLNSTNFEKLSDDPLRMLLSYFSEYRLRDEDFESPDVLGQAFKNLINFVAERSGFEGGEYTTPDELSQLLIFLLEPESHMKIYDPTLGTGGLLIESFKYISKANKNSNTLSLYGQDINQDTWALSKNKHGNAWDS